MCRNSFFVEDTHNCKLHRVSCPASCFRSDHSTACRERSPNLEFQHLFDVFSCPYSHFVPWPTAAGQTCKIGTLKALLHLKRFFKTLSNKNRWNWWNDEETLRHSPTSNATFQVPASQTPLQPSMDRKLPSSHCSPGWASITALSKVPKIIWTPQTLRMRETYLTVLQCLTASSRLPLLHTFPY